MAQLQSSTLKSLCINLSLGGTVVACLHKRKDFSCGSRLHDRDFFFKTWFSRHGFQDIAPGTFLKTSFKRFTRDIFSKVILRYLFRNFYRDSNSTRGTRLSCFSRDLSGNTFFHNLFQNFSQNISVSKISCKQNIGVSKIFELSEIHHRSKNKY